MTEKVKWIYPSTFLIYEVSKWEKVTPLLSHDQLFVPRLTIALSSHLSSLSPFLLWFLLGGICFWFFNLTLPAFGFSIFSITFNVASHSILIFLPPIFSLSSLSPSLSFTLTLPLRPSLSHPCHPSSLASHSLSSVTLPLFSSLSPFLFSHSLPLFSHPSSLLSLPPLTLPLSLSRPCHPSSPAFHSLSRPKPLLSLFLSHRSPFLPLPSSLTLSLSLPLSSHPSSLPYPSHRLSQYIWGAVAGVVELYL